MKVITKKECCETTSKKAADIKRGTVFSGVIQSHECICMAVYGPRIVLLVDNSEWKAGVAWSDNPIVADYKELKACLCIED